MSKYKIISITKCQTLNNNLFVNVLQIENKFLKTLNMNKNLGYKK